MPDNFFALLDNNEIRKIALTPAIESSIRTVFQDSGSSLYLNKDGIEFDGSYIIDPVDEVQYVTMELPREFENVANNPLAIPILNLGTEKIRALFWFENNTYFFQNFDNRKMLSHRFVIYLDKNSFNQLTENAFIVENSVSAAYLDNKLYFLSYASATKIFSLVEFYKEATDEDLHVFSAHGNISISDPQWFIKNSNTTIRKHVALLTSSNILESVDTKKIKRNAKKFKIPLDLDDQGKIIFPKNRQACRSILFYLNEQLYEGVITKSLYSTNSKKRM